MNKQLKIGNVVLKNNVILAPMAGFSDTGFRSLAYKFGVGLAVTEMVSIKALAFENEKTKDLLITQENERPVAVQIFGHEPEVFARVVKSGVFDKFDIIDINMGCPAPKIVNNGDGSALMQNLDLAREVIKAVAANTQKPVTVKFRAGFDKDNINAVEFAKMCEAAGASAITVHGRTRDQYYSGTSDLNVIRDVVKAVKIPVIANGDVISVEAAENTLKVTGAAGVMIGRGALGNLELISRLTEININMGKFEQIEYITSTLLKYHSEKFVLNSLRAHLVHFVKGMPLSTVIKQDLLTTQNLQNTLEKLKIYLK